MTVLISVKGTETTFGEVTEKTFLELSSNVTCIHRREVSIGTQSSVRRGESRLNVKSKKKSYTYLLQYRKSFQ